MFWLGFDKTLPSFVRNLVVEAFQCLRALLLECFGALAFNNFQKVRA
jgi:hypothetical protein